MAPFDALVGIGKNRLWFKRTATAEGRHFQNHTEGTHTRSLPKLRVVAVHWNSYDSVPTSIKVATYGGGLPGAILVNGLLNCQQLDCHAFTTNASST